MTEARLMTLSPDGRRPVTLELMTGQRAFWEPDAYGELLRPTMPEMPLNELDEGFDRLLAELAPFDTSLDAPAAELLRRSLPLTRRAASEPGVWRYLAVVRRPDVVRHRWELRSQRQMASRFWRMGTRLDSNVFSRLWWIAEHTRDGDDYTLTHRLCAEPRLCTALFSRELGWYRPLVRACVDVLGGRSTTEIERDIKLLSKRLSVVVLESQSEAALRTLVASLS